jgi:predicted metal-binding protein
MNWESLYRGIARAIIPQSKMDLDPSHHATELLKFLQRYPNLEKGLF